MKHLTKFEKFYVEPEFEDEYEEKDEISELEEEGCDTCESEASEVVEVDEKKKNEVSYEKSGLKNPKKADLDKNKKISEYEKSRGKAIEDSIEDKEEGKSKGLTAKQKKLPEGLRKAIEKKKKNESSIVRFNSFK